jgi:hypothetical protein
MATQSPERKKSPTAIGMMAIGIAALATLLTLMVTPADAMYIEHPPLRNLSTDRCIDHSFAYGLRQFGCNGGIWQKWERTRWRDGTSEFRNVATGWCLDDSYAYGLRAFPCNATRYQSWYVIEHRHWFGTAVELRNQATGRCVDDAYLYGLRAFPCNGSYWQRWLRFW